MCFRSMVWMGMRQRCQIEIIERDNQYWQAKEPKWVNFYMACMLPELCEANYMVKTLSTYFTYLPKHSTDVPTYLLVDNTKTHHIFHVYSYLHNQLIYNSTYLPTYLSNIHSHTNHALRITNTTKKQPICWSPSEVIRSYTFRWIILSFLCNGKTFTTTPMYPQNPECNGDSHLISFL